MSDFRFTNRISFFKKHQLFAFFYLLLIGVLKRICQPLYKNNDFLLKLISISLVLGGPFASPYIYSIGIFL
jgi:hypothetical protein